MILFGVFTSVYHSCIKKLCEDGGHCINQTFLSLQFLKFVSESCDVGESPLNLTMMVTMIEMRNYFRAIAMFTSVRISVIAQNLNVVDCKYSV